MNADVLAVGDLVFFNYGCMVGEDFGTVVGFEDTAFGKHAWVRKSDFSLTPVDTLRGVVTGRVVADYEGAEFFSARGVDGIGAYQVAL